MDESESESDLDEDHEADTEELCRFEDLAPLPSTEAEAGRKALGKIRAGIRAIRASHVKRKFWADVCGVKQKKVLMPILDMKVRWSSTYNMINRILQYEEVRSILLMIVPAMQLTSIRSMSRSANQRHHYPHIVSMKPNGIF